MTLLEQLELWSYVATIVGFPWLILTFWYERKKERINDQEELFLSLSREYDEFLRLVLANSDLQLMSNSSQSLEGEKAERRHIIFGILVSIFERAFILVYEDDMDKQTARLWQSWEDYIKEWCSRDDFRTGLKHHLHGEDPDFVRYMSALLEKLPTISPGENIDRAGI
jgi:hypothetical protein